MPLSERTIVFDASVVLAIVFREPGHEVMMDLKGVALVSSVNIAEVRSRLLDGGYQRGDTDRVLGNINIQIVDFDAEQAALSAELRPPTRALGLSLGDRACLALGLLKKAVVYTADRVWSKLDLPVEVRVVR
jgi:PIN domain nuclease of toxin-antitoxin system